MKFQKVLTSLWAKIKVIPARKKISVGLVVILGAVAVSGGFWYLIKNKFSADTRSTHEYYSKSFKHYNTIDTPNGSTTITDDPKLYESVSAAIETGFNQTNNNPIHLNDQIAVSQTGEIYYEIQYGIDAGSYTYRDYHATIYYFKDFNSSPVKIWEMPIDTYPWNLGSDSSEAFKSAKFGLMGMKVGSDGLLYAAINSRENNTVYKIDKTGAVKGQIPLPSGSFYNVFFDDNNPPNIYIGSSSKFDPASNTTTDLAKNFSGCTNDQYDKLKLIGVYNNELYVVCYPDQYHKLYDELGPRLTVWSESYSKLHDYTIGGMTQYTLGGTVLDTCPAIANAQSFLGGNLLLLTTNDGVATFNTATSAIKTFSNSVGSLQIGQTNSIAAIHPITNPVLDINNNIYSSRRTDNGGMALNKWPFDISKINAVTTVSGLAYVEGVDSGILNASWIKLSVQDWSVDYTKDIGGKISAYVCASDTLANTKYPFDKCRHSVVTGKITGKFYDDYGTIAPGALGRYASIVIELQGTKSIYGPAYPIITNYNGSHIIYTDTASIKNGDFENWDDGNWTKRISYPLGASQNASITIGKDPNCLNASVCAQMIKGNSSGLYLSQKVNNLHSGRIIRLFARFKTAVGSSAQINFYDATVKKSYSKTVAGNGQWQTTYVDIMPDTTTVSHDWYVFLYGTQATAPLYYDQIEVKQMN